MGDKVLRCGKFNFALGKKTYIIGIVNVTPDSFSDGGRFLDPGVAIKHAVKLVEDGADILDIGGESTRPGARPVSLEQELERVLPVIEGIRDSLDVPVSIDTYKEEVAREALDSGANIVNDISGLRNSPGMAKLVAEREVPAIIMHMQGQPRNMQMEPSYEDVVREITDFFRAQVKVAMDAGVADDRIILDPGIGFGKTVEHNLEIIRGFEKFRDLGFPLLIGTSRKSFIGKILDVETDGRLEGTIASTVAGVMNGADFVRVHDVRELRKAMIITDRILGKGR
jgi:dihydropteroate synthase